MAELVAPADPAPLFATAPESAFEGGARRVDEGEYCGEAVRAFEPAEEEPEAEKEVAAPGPLVPAEALESR